MPTFRVNKTKDYTVLSNHHLRNKEMSLKAKGLLSVILSLPDNWEYSINGFVAISKESKSSIQSTIKELEKLGYVTRERKQGSDGKFFYEYNVFERPLTEIPRTENPCTDIPCSENMPQLNTNKSSTKELNTNTNNIYGDSKESKTTTKRFTPPTVEEVSEYCKERNNNVDAEHFVDYYMSKGWNIGKNSKMKDWKAAVRNWERNEKKFSDSKPQQKKDSAYHMVDDSDILDGLF